MPRVLFICTGNICRSPAAEGLLKHRLRQKGLTDWDVESAGTWTVDGRPVTGHVVQLMAEREIDLTPHRSRGVERHMIEQADLVLVMTQGHAEALRLEFPDQSGKIYLLSEMKDGRRYDIEDPYGGSLEEYQTCVDELEELINEGLEQITYLAERTAH